MTGRPTGGFRLIASDSISLILRRLRLKPKLHGNFDARTPEQPSVRQLRRATASPPTEPEIAGCGTPHGQGPTIVRAWCSLLRRSAFRAQHSTVQYSWRLAPHKAGQSPNEEPGGTAPPLLYPLCWRSARATCSAASRPRRSGRRADLPTWASSWHQPWNRTTACDYNARPATGKSIDHFQRDVVYGKGWQEEG